MTTEDVKSELYDRLKESIFAGRKEETTYYWKGSAFPIALNHPHEKQMEEAKKMIAVGLLTGESMKEQSAYYKEQLDAIEKALWKHNRNFTEENLKEIAEELGVSLDTLHSLWCLNVCALLIMGEIKNDDNYGVLQTFIKC
jgi:DNA-binding NtrC family response regulator